MFTSLHQTTSSKSSSSHRCQSRFTRHTQAILGVAAVILLTGLAQAADPRTDPRNVRKNPATVERESATSTSSRLAGTLSDIRREYQRMVRVIASRLSP
jgi:hypothetical protein